MQYVCFVEVQTFFEKGFSITLSGRSVDSQ